MRADRCLHLHPSENYSTVLKLAVVLLGVLLASCASFSARGPTWDRVHVVQRGDTVWSIAQRYGTTVPAVARVNQLRNVSRIQVGDRLRVPGRTRLGSGGGQGGVRRAVGSRVRTGVRSNAPLVWPVEGVISSRFGPRRGAHHDGLDIAAPRGTPVLAAADGRVVHSDNALSGYGNLIILKHSDGRSTIYAHNRTNRVRVGQWVRAGQRIAEVGATGRATAPHLHFEVRQDGRAYDPLEFLP
jgi:murein DD-endopeptidase MepM/ murein hydrolase activator NlpD